MPPECDGVVVLATLQNVLLTFQFWVWCCFLHDMPFPFLFHMLVLFFIEKSYHFHHSFNFGVGVCMVFLVFWSLF